MKLQIPKGQTPKEYSEWLVDLQVEGQPIYAWSIAEYIKSYANQRVLEELHNLYNEEEEHNDCISKELIYQRIKELKQE